MSLYCSVWTFPTFTVVVVSLFFGNFGMYIPYINLVSTLFAYNIMIKPSLGEKAMTVMTYLVRSRDNILPL